MAHFGNYDPSSFGWAYAAGSVPFTYGEVPFPQGVANEDVAVIFREALSRLVRLMGEPLGVHGDCWGYEPRLIVGGTSRSFHGYGLAIDVNAVSNGQTSQPMTAATTTLPLNTGALVADLGIEWGGDWTAQSPRDPMHLELHLDPGEAHALAVHLTIAAKPAPVVLPPGGAVPVIMFTRDPAGKPQAPCWFYGDGTRSHPLGPDVWTAVNELHRLGVVQFAPVTQPTYNAFPIRSTP